MKKSNPANVIVAIIAVALILGGVFILNRAFSNRNNNDDDTSSSSSRSSVVASSARSSSTLSSTASSATKDDPTQTGSSSSRQSSNSSTSSNRSGSSSSTSSNSSLRDGEVVVKVLSVDGSKYQIETVDSKGITSKYFAKGAKTNITLSGVSLTAGKNYRVKLSVTDTATGFDISLFQILGEV